MAQVNDPDNLSQGAVDVTLVDLVGGAPTGQTVAFTSAGSFIPTITAGMYIEIRGHTQAEYNGLWVESGGSPTNAAATLDKADGVTLPGGATGATAVTWLGDSGALANEKSVHYNVGTQTIRVFDQGNVSTDGVLKRALFSFTKEEWKNDNHLNPYDFPYVGITPEQFELPGWFYEDAQTRKRLRSGGWSELRADGELLQQYAGIVTLGTFEAPGADVAEYQLGDDPTDTTAAVPFTFAGPVDEAILVYDLVTAPPTVGHIITTNNVITRDAGSFISEGYVVGGGANIINAEDAGNNGLGTLELSAVTALVLTFVGTPLTNNADDTTMEIAVDNREAVKLKLRIRDGDTNGKTFDSSNLLAIGQTAVDNKVFRFPLSNATDLKITSTDATITGGGPWTEIRLRYLAETYNREVDTVTKRNFGVVVDVGTYSQANGVTAISTLFTSAALGLGAGEALADYAGGSLVIHEGADQGTHVISGTPVDNADTLEVTLTVALTTVDTSVSFTMYPASPIAATAEQIFEKVQYQLRQAADVDATDGVVTGDTADELLVFVGDSLRAGSFLGVNPNGGGSGVIIEGFDANDTNRISFWDNGGIERTFPFVAAGVINWNTNLEVDTNGTYWMYFQYTERFTNTGHGLSAPTGDLATLDSTTTDLVAELANGDYVNLTGWTNPDLDGIYVLTGAPAGSGPWTATVRRVDGTTLVAEAAAASVSLDKNPVGSPDAILVKDNNSVDITASTFGGGLQDPFDFDYDNNVQGGRTAATNAEVLLKAIGFDTGQYVETTGTITRAVGQAFTLVSALERNYNNP